MGRAGRDQQAEVEEEGIPAATTQGANDAQSRAFATACAAVLDETKWGVRPRNLWPKCISFMLPALPCGTAAQGSHAQWFVAHALSAGHRT